MLKKLLVIRPNCPLRELSFLNRTGFEIWKATVSVSNAGAKKGRGRRGSIKAKNLNIGQKIGVGPLKANFPGLNTHIDSQIKITEEGINETYEKDLEETRQKYFSRPRKQIGSDRGWSGGILGGRSVGGKETIEGFDASDFDTRILYTSQKMIMAGKLGKQKRSRVIVGCGNGNGIFGLGAHVAPSVKEAINEAKEKAFKHLFYIEFDRFDNTVLHSFRSEFGYARLYVKRGGDGSGLICHRQLRSICELIGIRNLYAKSDGSRNLVSIANAFLLGLIKQKSYQQWADETNLYYAFNCFFKKISKRPNR